MWYPTTCTSCPDAMAPTRETLIPIASVALVIVEYSRGFSSVQYRTQIGRAVPCCGRLFGGGPASRGSGRREYSSRSSSPGCRSHPSRSRLSA